MGSSGETSHNMSIQFRTRTRGINPPKSTLFSGACCSVDNCTDTVLANCPVGSVFYGGQNCEDNPCILREKSRSFYGVCCDKNGFCDITTEEECECRNGTWKGNDFDCLSYDCCAGATASLQACCMGSYIKGVSGDYSWSGTCKDLKSCECLNLGGVPRGPLSTCSEINIAGGCGVTGATAYGSCCTTGNCLSPDDKEHPNGYTAGDCAILNGLWGGSGSTCGDGTTFSNEWPCSWPTGSCCFGHKPYNGITYCDSGKTCGDCLNEPPGGSGGLAWTFGATCGTLTTIKDINCNYPSGTDKGTCCIPEYFGVEDPDIHPFVVDYKCYVTSEGRCISLGGLWNNELDNCDDVDCCSVYSDCTFGENGACCHFNINTGEFIQCDNTTIYHCDQIAANNKNTTTLFHIGEECNDDDGYPCRDDILFTTDSCCIWQKDGTYIGCQNIGENDICPPTDIHVGIRFDQPCQSPGFNCSAQEVGACCYGSLCSFTSKGQCIVLNGVFYEGLNCHNNCDVIPCCSSSTMPVITGYNKDNKSVTQYGIDRCLDSFSVSSHLDKDFASDYLIDFGIDNPNALYSRKNQDFGSCEDCDCPYSRNRGSCCWDGKCIPAITQDECRQLGGIFQGCNGKPFENISQSWATSNPCINNGCSKQRVFDEEDGEEDFDILGENFTGRITNDIQYELLLTGRKDANTKEYSVPFFGFVDVETKPIDIQDEALPLVVKNTSILYWKISGKNPRDTMMVDIPFPTDPTSYQYIQGYYHPEQGNQNKFYWGATNQNSFTEYKNNVRQLWLTRKYQTPENVELSNTFEPYYHSKVEFSQVPNLEKLVINPARYGNGRNEYNEEYEWSICSDMVGYYTGLYLSKDMINSGHRGSKIKTLIAEDSSIDVICTPMQYFNISKLKELEVVHVSNNELYRLDIGNDNKIREIWAENNKLGSNEGTSWINHTSYPSTQESFPMYKLSKIQRLSLSNNDIKSLNTRSVRFGQLTSLFASNNRSLNDNKKLHLNVPSLEYLDLSGCGLGAGIVLENAANLKQIVLRNVFNLGNEEDIFDGHFHFINGRNQEVSNLQSLILTNSKLGCLNLGINSQKEWGDSGDVGIYNEYGGAFLNLKYIDLSNNSRLYKVKLPKPSQSYSDSNKEYIKYLNISGTSMGENINDFFNQAVFMNPEAYPYGHVLEVSARNITNRNGNIITLSLDKYNEIVNLWDGSGKFIILDVDINK